MGHVMYVCLYTYISNRACITLCGLWLVVCRDLCGVRRRSDMTRSLFCVLAYDSLSRLCAGASLSRNTTLTSLNLPDNLIGDAGFGDLADSLPVRLRVCVCVCVCVCGDLAYSLPSRRPPSLVASSSTACANSLPPGLALFTLTPCLCLSPLSPSSLSRSVVCALTRSRFSLSLLYAECMLILCVCVCVCVWLMKGDTGVLVFCYTTHCDVVCRRRR